MRVTLRFSSDRSEGEDVSKLIRTVGVMPVPPYIRGGRGDADDVIDYQTTFAKVDGSVAAPTASLHFTPELMERIRAVGCSVEFVTLHVGAPSFTAVWTDEAGSPELIPPGTELYRWSKGALDSIAACRARGGRVIGVGTTVVRALESMVRNPEGRDGEWYPTALFIRPGFEFKTIDRMVTNFHQPRSTHLLLVEAFVGGVVLDRIYQYALKADYRFFSYGDGMLLER
jgi:S-adenosylmethionine:tRNA ribosyltransferase-isomerase